MGCTRGLFVADTFDLFELLHQMRFVLQATGGIDENDVGAPRLAAAMASKATAAGSPLGAPLTISVPRRDAHVSSCSTAAARNVSEALIRTFFPLDWKCWASLAMLVVLPLPFTPTIRRTVGPEAASDNVVG